ncbi:MAG: hypothetical protein HY329_22600 [Chloroflexi bacterium]|nr:hypothetical protein [Chloroflexota bacterium]
MITVRPLLPTDLLPFLSFYRRTPREQGLVGRNNATRSLGLTDFAGIPLQHCWIALRDGQIAGITAVRPGSTVDTWQIERFVCLPDVQEAAVRLELLRRLCESAAEEGVQRIFIRSHADSPLVDTARQIAFVQYTNEILYRHPHVPRVVGVNYLGFRARRGKDHHALFRLYSSAVPGSVRQAEGMTLEEWRRSEGWRLHSPRRGFPFTDRRRDYVVGENGTIFAWLQIDRSRRSISVLVDPKAEISLEGIVEFGLSKLNTGAEALCLVRDYQGGLAHALEARGFGPVAEHALLVRMLAVWVKEPRLVPVRA